MSKNKDSWCTALYRRNEKPLYGGAARNYRISKSGGMDAIVQSVVIDALEKANSLAFDSVKNDFSPLHVESHNLH